MAASLTSCGKVAQTHRINFAIIQKCLYSTVVSTEKKKATKEPGSNGIPFLFLPHIARKAYIVNETPSSTITNTFDKFLWLTKTDATEGLPLSHQQKEVDESFHEDFSNSILQTVGFQKKPKLKDVKRLVPDRIIFSIFSNLINKSIFKNYDKQHLHPKNSILCFKPKLETHWVRNYNFYQTKFQPTFVLKTKTGFDIVEEPEEMHPNDVMSRPGPYDNYSMNLYRHPIVHLKNRPSLDNDRYTAFKHCHTNISVNNRLRTDEQLYTCGMFSLFSQLSAQAQTTGALHGLELEDPLVAQGIITNGCQVVFMVYQLNTLKHLDDKGVWNRFWHSKPMNLFEQDSEGPWNICEEVPCEKPLRGYNKEICNHFVSFIGKDTVA